MSPSLTVLQIFQENCLVLFLIEVWRKVSDKQRNIRTMRILLQLEIEPRELHQSDGLEASSLQDFPGNVIVIEDRLRHSARLQRDFHQLVFVHWLSFQTEPGQGLAYHLLCADAGRHGDCERGCGHSELPRPDLDHSSVVLVVSQPQQDGGSTSFFPDQPGDRLRVLALIFRLVSLSPQLLPCQHLNLLLAVSITNSVNIKKIKILRFLKMSTFTHHSTSIRRST